MNNMAHNYLFCQKNGGCDSYAYCTMTGPLERNCTCRLGFIGDGESCKGTLQKVRSTENKQAHKWNNTLTVSSTHFSFLGDPKKKCWKCLRGTVGKLNLLFTQSCFLPWDCDLTKDSFLFFLQRINPELGNRGPFTVFLPNSKAYKPPEVRLECCTIMEKKVSEPFENLTSALITQMWSDPIKFKTNTISLNLQTVVLYSIEDVDRLESVTTSPKAKWIQLRRWDWTCGLPCPLNRHTKPGYLQICS